MRGALIAAGAVALAAAAWGAETRIRGGTMELQQKGEIVVFRNGVVLEREGDRLKADWMRTTRRRDRIEARGDVALFRRMSSTQTVEGFGQTGLYDTRTGASWLKGNRLPARADGSRSDRRGQAGRPARLVYTEILSSTSTRVLRLRADRFDFFEKEERATGSGEVYGETKDPETGALYEFWSETAEFFQAESKIVLSGTPAPKVRRTLKDKIETVNGNVITYHIDERRFLADGAARAHLVEDKSAGTRP